MRHTFQRRCTRRRHKTTLQLLLYPISAHNCALQSPSPSPSPSLSPSSSPSPSPSHLHYRRHPICYLRRIALNSVAMAAPLRHGASRALVLSGCTGIGKSQMAMALAQRLDGEIISADSVAVYRELDIGSDKPSRLWRSQVFASPFQSSISISLHLHQSPSPSVSISISLHLHYHHHPSPYPSPISTSIPTPSPSHPYLSILGSSSFDRHCQSEGSFGESIYGWSVCQRREATYSRHLSAWKGTHSHWGHRLLSGNVIARTR